jgi:DNA helicase HerA-like ATPase
MLGLNDTQAGVLEIAFRVADDDGLLLLDLEDLRALLAYVAQERKAVSARYGLVNAQSVGAIQRALLSLEREGGEQFFGEPALSLPDLLRTDAEGRGVVNILMADQLILRPRLYATFLLWLLSELFENLPEVGDLPRPKLAFIVDEAHLLFDDAPPALRQRVEQAVRLIRSKGVGVYFCSQFPDDVPGEILGQLANRVQHALRAYTPRDRKAVRAAAETFASNPGVDVTEAIGTLGVGEALASMLQDNGVPMPVERIRVAPPRSRVGAITADERQRVLASSPVAGVYDTAVNRESAHEQLARRVEAEDPVKPADAVPPAPSSPAPGGSSVLSDMLWGSGRRQGMVEAMAKQAARSVGSQLGRQILRGLLGGITAGSRRR